MDKQIVASYPYNGILFSNKKEQSTDTCYNMTGCQKHYVKWKKINPEDTYFTTTFKAIEELDWQLPGLGMGTENDFR